MSGDGKGGNEVELEIFNRFSQIVRERFTSLAEDDGGEKAKRLDVIYKLPEFQPEKQILKEMNNMGLSKGVFSGLACFAFLRISPRLMSRMLQRRAGVGGANPFNQTSGYKLDPPPSGQANLERPGIAFRAVRLALDTFVSVSIGAYASLYFLDKEKMMNQFSDIPLVEGRSLLSEELCEDFTREFQKFDPEIWDRKHPSLNGGGHLSNQGERDFRNTMQGFVANCRRRAIYEEEKRKEWGLRDNESVAIPSPGVPRDISVSLDDLLGETEFGEGIDDDSRDGDDYFDTYFDMDDEGKD